MGWKYTGRPSCTSIQDSYKILQVSLFVFKHVCLWGLLDVFKRGGQEISRVLTGAVVILRIEPGSVFPSSWRLPPDVFVTGIFGVPDRDDCHSLPIKRMYIYQNHQMLDFRKFSVSILIFSTDRSLSPSIPFLPKNRQSSHANLKILFLDVILWLVIK